ncbi:MAG: hypothetical protein K2J04_01475 [Lachnospiraceae bacterium]|nr:hypothetical protein [Lachnospiraceae bacterium]
MIKVLMEIFEPELRESERIGRIKGAVETLNELGFGNREIEAKIMKSYNIDVVEASKYL